MITTRKEELMPLYDFCNVIPQELLDEKDIDNLPKFKVEISPNQLICIVKNKNAESIHLTFKGHRVIFIDDGKQKIVYSIVGQDDTCNILNILSKTFSVSIEKLSMINEKKKKDY